MILGANLAEKLRDFETWKFGEACGREKKGGHACQKRVVATCYVGSSLDIEWMLFFTGLDWGMCVIMGGSARPATGNG